MRASVDDITSGPVTCLLFSSSGGISGTFSAVSRGIIHVISISRIHVIHLLYSPFFSVVPMKRITPNWIWTTTKT